MRALNSMDECWNLWDAPDMTQYILMLCYYTRMAVLTINLESRSTRIGAQIRLVNGQDLLEAGAEFDFEWGRQDQEDLRWYLEDYLIYPADPAPKIAARVEQSIAATGILLFSDLFRGDPQASRLWEAAVEHLADLRVEIQTSEPRLARLPWELIREPNSQMVLALSCRSFARVHSRPSRPALQSTGVHRRVRMLLVLCRPGGANDVPFRSIASRLLKGLHKGFGRNFQVEVLRPPTYGQLNAVLRKAARESQPYHIVHFDGHGLTGGLVFENPKNPQNMEIVTGETVGRLLADAQVPAMVLNACRSAFADPPPQPKEAGNIHEEIRVFGSLAHVVADQGVPCVLAMRFNVFVETAAHFMLNFYSAWAEGSTMGEAVSAARTQLSAEPLRESMPHAVRLEDWIVPVSFEAKSVRLFEANHPGGLTQSKEDGATGLSGLADSDLPRRPDAGFFGRDETLLALDRAFDSDNLVLLQAYAGSGKTTAAAEFARWYLETGGTKGPVLFTSFDTKRTLGQVLDQLGRRLEPQIAKTGIEWPTILDPQERRRVALEILSGEKILWIWDNVEPIAGFPTGTASEWETDEQRELADFLRDAREGGTKFLLTSRRDESAWLGMLPTQVIVPPMPFWERVQLTQALAKKMNRRAFEVENWRPLLEFTQGNPLTLTILVTQVLRSGLRSADEMAGFVAGLQDGTTELRDDPAQGRSSSLTAALNYGLEHAFSEEERKIIALLHFFQGYVNIKVFELFGSGVYALPEVERLSGEEIRKIFEVARELGILERFSGTVYRIHPAVPWFFRAAFERCFAGRERDCKLIFCLAVGTASSRLSKQFNRSSSEAAAGLIIEEPNLRYALKLGIEVQQWTGVMAALHGLEDLYTRIQGNRAGWQKIVLEVSPLVTKGSTGRAISGREIAWRAVTEYRMRIAKDAGEFAEAERLARILVEYWREVAAPILADEADLAKEREEIHNLAVMLESLAYYLSQQGSADGLDFYHEALVLSLRDGDRRHAALCAQNLGWAHRDVECIRDLDKALAWFLKAIELAPEDDVALVGKSLVMCGSIFFNRFDAAYERGDMPEIRENARLGIGAYEKALELLPVYAYDDRAESLGSLGNFLLRGGQYAEAEKLFREALPLARQAGAFQFETASLLNIASALKEQGRFTDAITYARAAEQGAAALGPAGEQFAIGALGLLAAIRDAQKAEGQS